MAGFGVALEARDRFVLHLIPENLARDLIEGKQVPLVHVLVVSRLDIAVKSHLEIGLAGSSRRGHVDPITPQDRR